MATESMLLDSGVWIAAGTPGERFASAARRVVADTSCRTAALDLTLYEVANVVGARRGDVAGAAWLCRSIEVRCEKVLVRADPDLIEATAEIAVEHGLTSYDAAYVAVARRYDWQLVSTDVADLVSKGLAITPDAAV
jgi:predicted nucleic acid-binding protein